MDCLQNEPTSAPTCFWTPAWAPEAAWPELVEISPASKVFSGGGRRSASPLMRASTDASDGGGAPRLMASSVARNCSSYSRNTPRLASSGVAVPGGMGKQS